VLKETIFISSTVPSELVSTAANRIVDHNNTFASLLQLLLHAAHLCSCVGSLCWGRQRSQTWRCPAVVGWV